MSTCCSIVFGSPEPGIRTVGVGYCSIHAAAPELLEIARQVAGLYLPDDDNPRDPSRGIAKLARAAIRKAEGQS